jgi:hypothetical protein
MNGHIQQVAAQREFAELSQQGTTALAYQGLRTTQMR